MTAYYIRYMEVNEINGFYKRIEEDFPPEEHAPYRVFYRQILGDIQEGLVFGEGAQDMAYSVCADNHTNGYVLISLLAVFQEFRGQGIGSAFLKALRVMYARKQAIIVEVERPELAETEKERDLCRRRIDFYEKAGFYLIQGINYLIWDVPMHLMALPLNSSIENINKDIEKIMYQIYYKMVGESLIHKLEFQATNESVNDNVINSYEGDKA
jgi:GNAT superfamily N-acetyltransferase